MWLLESLLAYLKTLDNVITLALEFCVLGLFAGILATFGSEFTVYALEVEIFELDYSLNPSLWILGPVIGTVLIGVVGTIATLKVVRTPPTIILREAG